jgi:hypothetical protein
LQHIHSFLLIILLSITLYLFTYYYYFHIHFFQNGGLYARPDAIDLRNKMPYNKEIELSHQTMEGKLRRYLQNGITNVIDVGATNNFLKLDDTNFDTLLTNFNKKKRMYLNKSKLELNDYINFRKLDVMNKFMFNTNYYTNDQVYLRDYIYPYVKETTMIHCMKEGWFKDTRLKLKNKYSFCGNGYDEHDMPLYPGSMKEFEGFDQKNLPASAKFDKGLME